MFYFSLSKTGLETLEMNVFAGSSSVLLITQITAKI